MSTAGAATVVIEPVSKVMGAETVVLPLALKSPLAVVRTIREVPVRVAVPTAVGLVVRVFRMSHEVGPLTVSVPPLPNTRRASRIPPFSMTGEVMVRFTPWLIVCVWVRLSRSQSRLPTEMVVFAVTVGEPPIRSLPAPVISPPLKVGTAFKSRVAAAATVVTEDGPKVILALAVVLPLALKLPLISIPALPARKAVPAAAGLVVRLPTISHEAKPPTFRVALLPRMVSGSSMSPSLSKFVQVMAKVAPSLMIWLEPDAVPSQSTVWTATVL